MCHPNRTVWVEDKVSILPIWSILERFLAVSRSSVPLHSRLAAQGSPRLSIGCLVLWTRGGCGGTGKECLPVRPATGSLLAQAFGEGVMCHKCPAVFVVELAVVGGQITRTSEGCAINLDCLPFEAKNPTLKMTQRPRMATRGLTRTWFFHLNAPRNRPQRL